MTQETSLEHIMLALEQSAGQPASSQDTFGSIAVKSQTTDGEHSLISAGDGEFKSALEVTDNGDIEYTPVRERGVMVPGVGSKSRPYNEDEAAIILELYASGLPYKTVFGSDTIATWFYRWMADHPELEEAWMLATKKRAQRFGEQVVEIADQAEKDGTDPAYAKIRIAARQWFAERLAPSLFGNRSTVTHNVNADPEIAKRLEMYHRLKSGPRSLHPPIVEAVLRQGNPDLKLLDAQILEHDVASDKNGDAQA